MNLTPDLEIVYLDPHDLTPYEGNARKHGDVDVQGIKYSIETDGFNDPIGIWGDNNLIVEGHGRQLAAIALGMEKVPCIRLDHLTDAQRRDYAIRHNRTAELSEWDEAKKQIELEALQMEGFDVGDLFESQGEQDQASTEAQTGSLAERYIVPPFSVLYGNKHEWLKRKRKWIGFGIRSELGRGGTCLQYKERPNGKLPTASGGEKSKAFKNNTRLNSYMTGRKHSPQTLSQGFGR